MSEKKPAAKKPKPVGPPAAEPAAKQAPRANAAGWIFHEHETDGVIGQKRFDRGVTQREVHGKDLAEAKDLADVIDNQVAQRENGRIEAAAREADELRARAKALEGK